MKKFDLIAFDWDGTLMDSTAVIVKSIQAAATDIGIKEPTRQAASHVIGLGLQEALQYAVPGLTPDRYGQLLERYRHHYLRADESLVLFPGVAAMLQDLRSRGCFLAVATGKSRVGLNRALHASGLLSMFDATRCADETFSKPNPAMLFELTRELGQSMERTLMVGDTTHDLQLAKNAGAAAVAVTYGAHPHHELLEFEPLFVAHNVEELHAWLLESI